jgi:ATP-independent RNA helicase DbpA
MTNVFKSLTLRKELSTNLSEIGFSKMTPIQAGSLPIILSGKDVIGQAKTGSGKTAAFGLGILNSLDVNNIDTQALILCPTRELAEQVSTELRRLARMMKNVKILTITGGTGYHHQENSLDHGAHIIVGTPGRVAKLIGTRFILIDYIKTLVLDEADRLLDMGFYDEIMGIEEKLTSKEQTLLFSATFPDQILELSSTIQTDAEKIIVDSEHDEGSIEQYFYEVDSHKNKDAAVLRILGEFSPERLIIFCKTKMTTDKLSEYLQEKGILASSIHGDFDQSERTKILTMFSNRSLTVLVATDVAARGLDIKDLTAVINYDLAGDTEDYVHRVGRTGRAGKKGLALSLFVEAEEYKIDQIQEIIKEECIRSPIEGLPDTKKYLESPPMATIYISGGKKDKLRPGDILGALVKEAGLAPTDVGDISILPILTYVAVKKECAKQAISRLSKGRIKNRHFRVGLVSLN